MNYKGLIASLVYIKSKGIPKSEALDYLDIDPETKVDMEMLKDALEEVYG